MGPLQRAQNHLVSPGTAEGPHHRGDLAMRSHHTGKEKEEAGGCEMDDTDTRWLLTAIKDRDVMEDTCGPSTQVFSLLWLDYTVFL